jgi:hypothetical protein
MKGKDATKTSINCAEYIEEINLCRTKEIHFNGEDT